MFLGELYPYQQAAFDFAVERRFALIAYEMGLGKTPTSLAVIEELMARGEIQEAGLVFTLSSLKYQIAKEIERFTDSKALVIDGTPVKRQEQYALARDWETSGVDYIVMNYENVVNDFEEVSSLPRGFLLMDECTRLKSHTSKTHKAVKKLSKGVPVRIGLTGTPMENGKPDEVFHQLECIDPTVLGGFFEFRDRYIVRDEFYGWVRGYKNLTSLHRRLQDVMVSKKQKDPDVAPYLPTTIEKDPILVPMDRAGAKLYRRIANELIDELDGVAALIQEMDYRGEGQGPIGTRVSALRMLCDHPDLLRLSGASYDPLKGVGSEYLSDLLEDGVLTATKSPKVDAVAKYVTEFLESDPSNKVVVFSVFVPMVEKLEQALAKHGCVTYTGKMNARQKEAAKVKFQGDPDTRVFISSDAGGYGVDLPQANLLVNVDKPWSSGVARQRNGRVQRASSEWDHVVIQDFLIEGSLEEYFWDALQLKNKVESSVLEGSGASVNMSATSLRKFLKSHSV